jgi:hypothetical protein
MIDRYKCIWMNEYEWMNEWMNMNEYEWMHEWMHEWMNKWICMNEYISYINIITI